MSDDMDFKLHVLEDITDNFSEKYRVGSGGYGDVYRVRVLIIFSVGFNDKQLRTGSSDLYQQVVLTGVVQWQRDCSEEASSVARA